VLILRRRTFVINRKLQFSILLTSVSYVVLLAVVVSTALFAPLVLQLNQPDRNPTETSDAALRILYLHQTYWLPLLLTLLAIALHSVTASHRIAGPLYRFRRVCEAMTAGVVPKPVTLRKGDHLRAELDAVNAMLDTWRTLVAEAQRHGSRLHECLSSYRAPSTASLADPATDALWAEIVRTEQRLRETLSRVTCEDLPAGEPAPAPPRR
jgi:hypothetical protein